MGTADEMEPEDHPRKTATNEELGRAIRCRVSSCPVASSDGEARGVILLMQDGDQTDGAW
jgi:hypothetical protein